MVLKTFCIACLLLAITMHGSTQPRKGQAAPELVLPGLDGQALSLSSLKGKVVLIDFWASWCGPCRRNNPHLMALYKKFHEQGLEILGVSIDENEGNWRQAVSEDRLPWIQVIENRGWNAPSIISYDIEFIPSSFLLDKQGVIQAIDLTGSRLESTIKKLLKG